MRHPTTTETEGIVSAKKSFFAQQRYAVIGDSRTRPFPNLTKRYLEEKGKTVYPVDLAGGQPGFLSSVSEIPAEAQAAIVEVTKERTTDVVKQALDHGFTQIWLHQMTDTPEALELCRMQGATVNTGSCAVMYLAPTSSYHVIHRGIWKLLKRY
jgi:Predicted CoA-binding protein